MCAAHAAATTGECRQDVADFGTCSDRLAWTVCTFQGALTFGYLGEPGAHNAPSLLGVCIKGPSSAAPGRTRITRTERKEHQESQIDQIRTLPCSQSPTQLRCTPAMTDMPFVMGNIRFGRQAPYALLLIALLQVTPSYGHPVVGDPPRHEQSLDDVQYLATPTVTVPCSTDQLSHAVEQITNPVQQISDGQVQVHIPTSIVPTSSLAVVLQAPDGQLQQPIPSSYGFTRTTSSTTSSTLLQRDLSTNMLAQSITTTIPDGSLTSLSSSAVQTVSEEGPSSLAGSTETSPETSGNPTSQPFATSVPTATSSLALIDVGTLTDVQPTATSAVTELSASNIFQPIATNAPPGQLQRRADHPVPRLEIQPQDHKLQTNKFYSSLFLANQTSAVFLFPYSVAWVRGGGNIGSWGLGISHTDASNYSFSPPKFDSNTGFRLDAGESSYFYSPLGQHSIILSASELTNTSAGRPELTTEALEWGSVTANLFPIGWQTPVIKSSLVQGLSFITGNYNWGTPLIQTSIGFQEITYLGAVVDNITFKYSLLLKDHTTWLMYVTPDQTLCPEYAVNSFTAVDNSSASSLQGYSGFSGLIQIAKLPSNSSGSYSDPQSVYDEAAGAYATTVNITGTVEDTTGTYSLSWTKAGNQERTLLMFALPHHVASLSYDTQGGLTSLQLQTTVKGTATAIKGDRWTLQETNLPISMGFAPWTPSPPRSIKSVSSSAADAIYSAGLTELSQIPGIVEQADQGSFYYDGKALAKFAAMVYTQNDIVGNKTLAYSGLRDLKESFEQHVNGTQRYPLVYDEAWGGAVSNASYGVTDSAQAVGMDFGNTYYNDHHFHFGYFVYTAAVIAYLEPDWLTERNVAWVNTLVRDYANSIVDDEYFPFSRAFDWYHGHSWATGLFDQADGKNQESSSEDCMASYAIKMWGQVIGDENMMARGNLMLSIQARALQMYYLYESDNTVQPAEFIGNKAAGILFENKIDHTTFFGALPQYVQGIHAIPIMPFSTFIRTPAFVQQEWSAYFSNRTDGTNRYIDTIEDGWKGILMANYGIADPTSCYNFFGDSTFQAKFLDGGASRTWYLAFCAGLSAAQNGV